jgi:hypothetical protein
MSLFRAKLLGLIVLSSSKPIKQGDNFTCSHSCCGTKSHILMRKSLKTLKWPTENIGNELHYRLTYRLVKHERYGPLNSLFWSFCFYFVHHDTMFHITQWCLIPAWIMHNLHMASQLCILIKFYETNLRKVFIHIKIILKIICRNPILRGVWGHHSHSRKMGLGSPPGLLKTQNLIARGKTLRIEVFLISLKRSQSANV